MAARTSASTGTLVTVTVLGLATLGLFITSVVFFANKRAAETRATAAEATTAEFLSERDRNDPVIQRLKEDAKKKKSTVVGYMLTERKEIMQRATGVERDTVETMDLQLKNAGVTTNLLASVKDRSSQIDALKKQLGDAESARDRALQDKENESKRVKDIEAAQRQTVAALTAQVDQTKQEADTLRDEVTKFKASMDERVDRIRTDYTGKETTLKSEIDKLQSERVIDKDRLRKYELQIKGQRFAGPAEYALVDGQIIGINSADGTVVLSVGRKQKVVLGMTFEAFADGNSIKVDETTGQYPRGKASLEVIKVDHDSAVARVLREQKGNPIVRGDVIANAVFDPNKSYKFLVYGNFDPSRSGIPTPQGATEIKARIKSWGGDVVDDLSGDVDFIVLGARPALPPEPSANAPYAVIEEFLRLQRIAKRYDELLNQATSTSIPVLNENRLYTLTGSM